MLFEIEILVVNKIKVNGSIPMAEIILSAVNLKSGL